jgi:predicted peptidase
MRLHRRSVLGGLLAGGASSPARARVEDWTGFDIDGLHYEVMLPAAFDPAAAYPVLLYLHQLDLGIYREALRQQVDPWFGTEAFRTRHKAIVVMPMLDQSNDHGGRELNFGGKTTGHIGEETTIKAVRQVIERYHPDPSRIYVTGNSLGGMGTWDMLLSYNTETGTTGRIFAAGMPVAGAHRAADPLASAQALRNVPIWAVHGAQDKEISPSWDRAVSRLMPKGAPFRYTEVPEAGHDVWDDFYRRPDGWDWLFAQHSGR